MASKTGKLRACLLCSFVQTAQAFRREGCPNCDELLEMKGNSERVLECTTGSFDGTCALVNPAESWVAKYQRIGAYKPGLYAIRMSGQLPETVQEELEDKGINVKDRTED